jgi:hypothetical protein
MLCIFLSTVPNLRRNKQKKLRKLREGGEDREGIKGK